MGPKHPLQCMLFLHNLFTKSIVPFAELWWSSQLHFSSPGFHRQFSSPRFFLSKADPLLPVHRTRPGWCQILTTITAAQGTEDASRCLKTKNFSLSAYMNQNVHFNMPCFWQIRTEANISGDLTQREIGLTGPGMCGAEYFPAGRGENKNPRGGAKERVNQLIQKFDKCEYLELLWRYL